MGNVGFSVFLELVGTISEEDLGFCCCFTFWNLSIANPHILQKPTLNQWSIILML